MKKQIATFLLLDFALPIVRLTIPSTMQKPKWQYSCLSKKSAKKAKLRLFLLYRYLDFLAFCIKKTEETIITFHFIKKAKAKLPKSLTLALPLIKQ